MIDPPGNRPPLGTPPTGAGAGQTAQTDQPGQPVQGGTKGLAKLPRFKIRWQRLFQGQSYLKEAPPKKRPSEEFLPGLQRPLENAAVKIASQKTDENRESAPPMMRPEGSGIPDAHVALPAWVGFLPRGVREIFLKFSAQGESDRGGGRPGILGFFVWVCYDPAQKRPGSWILLLGFLIGVTALVFILITRYAHV